MTNLHSDTTDILDDEIRIISSDGKASQPVSGGRKPRLPWRGWVLVAVAIVLAIALRLTISLTSAADDDEIVVVQKTKAVELQTLEYARHEIFKTAAPYTSLTDTVIDQRRLTIMRPHNATAKLVIGDSILDADDPVLVVQAADVRRDNGQIVGAYVLNGDMKSRGKAKSGFCAIINNEITIGVAQTTPLLERATEEDGFFFRQYPLVYEGEVIENKPKNLSQRKALALLNDEVVVVLCHERLSFHDFSQALVDLGVKNAIYLVGSSAYMKAKLEDGNTYEFGTRSPNRYPNSNYIFWK